MSPDVIFTFAGSLLCFIFTASMYCYDKKSSRKRKWAALVIKISGLLFIISLTLGIILSIYHSNTSSKNNKKATNNINVGGDMSGTGITFIQGDDINIDNNESIPQPTKAIENSN